MSEYKKRLGSKRPDNLVGGSQINLLTLKLNNMETLRLNALALHLGVNAEELNVSSYDDNVIEYGSEEYLVVTDDEADELWEQDLDNYLEECIYPELPDNMRNYFDDKKWKRDARFDGRAHSLARYDGNEEYLTASEYDEQGESVYSLNEDLALDNDYYELIQTVTFYIYRQN